MEQLQPKRRVLEDRYKSAPKRFMLSSESFAQERLRSLKRAFQDIHREYPEVVSVLLYGSMTKGTAMEASDIDAWIIIDADVLQAREAKDGGMDQSVTETQVMGSGIQNVYLRPSLGKRYAELFDQRLMKEGGLSDEQVKHLRTLPMSEEIIRTSLEQLKQGRKSVPLNLYTLFHLSVGTGIKKFRQHLLRVLSKDQKDGERLWREIIAATEFMEQGMPIRSTGKRYPRTLAEAVQVYG